MEMDKEFSSVHGTHCCSKHGCKYGESSCPVVTGKELGIICMDCESELRNWVNDLEKEVIAKKKDRKYVVWMENETGRKFHPHSEIGRSLTIVKDGEVWGSCCTSFIVLTDDCEFVKVNYMDCAPGIKEEYE